jgi:2-keto-3-deoxy-L-rhamnonate aldolase RhmA
MFVPNVAEAATWLAEGAGFYLLGSDHAFMMAGARALVADFESAKSKAGR